MSIKASVALAILSVFAGLPVAYGDRLRDVDPFIGTSAMGNCYPGGTVPFGMVQPSPDSRAKEGEWHHCSGYKQGDPVISGFSQTHQSGIGCRGTMDILIQPFTGDGERVGFGGLKDFASEVASPGYYAVTLTNFGVRAEVTASHRVARYRWTYERGRAARVYLDLMWTWGPEANWYRPPVSEMSARIESCALDFSSDNRDASGSYHVMGWLTRDVSFVIRFSRPFASVRPLARRPGEKAPRYVFDFDLGSDNCLEAEIAISAVDLDGARKNLAAEGGRTFEAVRGDAEKRWSDLLSRVDVEGVTARERRIFYTSLYHLFVQPNDISDVDGRYRADGAVGRSRTADGSFYSGFSLWDTFRAAHPLYTILIPERVDSFCESLLASARTTGPLPILPFSGFDTGCMVGCHSVPVLVDAYLKGFRGFDPEEAFAAIDRTLSSDHPNRPKDANAIVRKYGYIPFDVAAQSPALTPFRASGRRESVSRLMEMCYDDACAARLAVVLGRRDKERFYLDRSRLWTNVFDRTTGFVRGRDAKGHWREPFDPHLGGYQTDFTEASAWVYTWHVMQEPRLLVDLLGGADSFSRKLDGLFIAPEGPAYRDGTGRIGQYAHGNEPSHHIAYLYPPVGRGDRTAEIVRELFDRYYSDRPDGVCGNDDCGQMGAWYVFSAMGFYPLDPCGGDYVIGAPQFPKMVLRLPHGTFTVLARNLSKENKYVKSVTLNGKPITDWKIRHADVVAGGEIVFEMGGAPNRPPSGREDSTRPPDSPHPACQTSDILCADVLEPASSAATDVSASLQAKLDGIASRGGGTLHLPAGVYTLASPVVLPIGTVIRGDYAPDDFAHSTVLRIVGGRGDAEGPAAVSMSAGSGLVGLYFWYPEQSVTNPVAYPWTVRSRLRPKGTDNHTVSDCTFVNAWQAIRFGPEPNELHLVRRVRMTALKTGFFVDSTTDVGRLTEVDVSPFHWINSGVPDAPDEVSLRKFLRTNGMIGFDFRRSDWEYAYRLRVDGAATGIRFARGARGSASGGFAGCETVACAVGMTVEDLCTAGLALYGCRFRNDENLKIGSKVPAVVVCDSCVFEGLQPTSETPHALVVSGSKSLPDLSGFDSREYASPAPGKIFRVGDFGADVKATDSTAAFQRALDAAGTAGGGTVYALPGNWAICGTLRVPGNVELRGSCDVPHHTISGGTILLTTSGRGDEFGTPFLSLEPRSSIRGFTVWYPEQPIRSPVPYPWTVRALGADCSIRDVTLANAWQGVDLATFDTTGHFVSFLCGNCWRRGIAVGKSRSGFLEDVHFNPHYVVRRPVGLPTTFGDWLYSDRPCSGGLETKFLRANFEAMALTDAQGECVRGFLSYAPAKGLAVRGSSDVRLLIGGADMTPEPLVVDLDKDGRFFSALAQLTPWDGPAGWHGPAVRILPTDAGRTEMRSSLLFLAHSPTLVKEGRGELLLDGFSSRLGRIDLRGGNSEIAHGIFACSSEGHVRIAAGEARISGLDQRRDGIRIEDRTGRAQVSDCRLAPPVDLSPRTNFRVGIDAPLLQNRVAVTPRGRVKDMSACSCVRTKDPGVTVRIKGHSDNPSYSCMYFEVATNAVRVTDDSFCSFRLKPLSKLGCDVSVDLAFADGSCARDRGLFLLPRPGTAKVGEWIDVRIPIGMMGGETVTHVMVRWDSRHGGGAVDALVSDLRINNQHME